METRRPSSRPGREAPKPHFYLVHSRLRAFRPLSCLTFSSSSSLRTLSSILVFSRRLTQDPSAGHGRENKETIFEARPGDPKTLLLPGSQPPAGISAPLLFNFLVFLFPVSPFFPPALLSSFRPGPLCLTLAWTQEDHLRGQAGRPQNLTFTWFTAACGYFGACLVQRPRLPLPFVSFLPSWSSLVVSPKTPLLDPGVGTRRPSSRPGREAPKPHFYLVHSRLRAFRCPSCLT